MIIIRAMLESWGVKAAVTASFKPGRFGSNVSPHLQRIDLADGRSKPRYAANWSSTMAALHPVWLLAPVLALSPLSHALAAEQPDDAGGRYAMSPVDGGFLRLDKQTGAVSMCARKDSTWTCEPVKESGLEPSPGPETGIDPKADPDRPIDAPVAGKPQLPTEEEIDQALDYVERIFKKFRDRVEKYKAPEPPTENVPPTNPPPSGTL